MGNKERLEVHKCKIGLPKKRGLICTTIYPNMTENVSHSANYFILSLGLTFSFDKSSQVKKTLFEGETGHLLNELIFLRSKLTPPSFDDPMTAA